MPGKYLKIKVDDQLGDSILLNYDGSEFMDIKKVYLERNEYPYIYSIETISDKKFNEALDTLITYLMQNHLYYIDVSLDRRNSMKGPAKEMTIEEIEDKLGHRIKIVEEE